LAEGANDADPMLPSAMPQARTEYADLKTGHLLNGHLGGDGKNPDNLTILSSAGNARMTKFDNRVKDACRALKDAYRAISELGVDLEEIKNYGIEVTVATNGIPWCPAPSSGQYASTELIGTAGVKQPPDLTTLAPKKDATSAQAAMAKVAAHVEAANRSSVITNPKARPQGTPTPVSTKAARRPLSESERKYGNGDSPEEEEDGSLYTGSQSSSGDSDGEEPEVTSDEESGS